MKNQSHTFTAIVSADPLVWLNMDIYAVFFAGDPKDEHSSKSEHESSPRGADFTLQVSPPTPCNEATLCLYVVPRNLPKSNLVLDSTTLTLSFNILRDKTLIATKSYTINQWAGLQLVGLRYE